jgi:hypothetical protein
MSFMCPRRIFASGSHMGAKADVTGLFTANLLARNSWRTLQQSPMPIPADGPGSIQAVTWS